MRLKYPKFYVAMVLLLVISACGKKGTNSQGNSPFRHTFTGAGRASASSVVRTADGGFVMAGLTWSDTYQLYLVKTDANGNRIWDRSVADFYGSVGGVVQTADGGYLVAGERAGAPTSDVYLVKTDAAGTLIWTRPFGGAGNDGASSLAPSADGGYFIVGYTFSSRAGSDVYLIKIDSAGNKLWERNLGGPGTWYDTWNRGSTAIPCADGGCVVAGNYDGTVGWTQERAYLLKVNSQGTVVWERRFDEYGHVTCATADASGGYQIAGTTYSNDTSLYDVFWMKTGATGNLLSHRTLADPDAQNAFAINSCGDGGCVIAGDTYSLIQAYHHVYMVKINTTGNKVWERTYGSGSDEESEIHSLVQTGDGGLVGVGTSGYAALFVKVDSLGVIHE